MNKLLNILLVLTLLTSCGLFRDIPEGAPEKIRPKQLRELVTESTNEYSSLRVRTMGTYSDSEGMQKFRLEIRILRDSLIWFDAADPILGIKVARAVLTKDSIAFYNKIGSEYLTGDVAKFQEEYKVNFGFEELQSILSANLIFPIRESYGLYYRPGFYLFSNFDPKDSDNADRYFAMDTVKQIFVEPSFYKPSEQVLKEPGKKRSYSVEHSGYSQRGGGVLYPDQINIRYESQAPASLNLEIRDVDVDDPNMNFPFNIPPGYEKMR